MVRSVTKGCGEIRSSSAARTSRFMSGLATTRDRRQQFLREIHLPQPLDAPRPASRARAELLGFPQVDEDTAVFGMAVGVLTPSPPRCDVQFALACQRGRGFG